MFKVFYSWQSDLPQKTNRNLIQDALSKACNSLKSTGGVTADSVVDRDTLNVAGAPVILNTILNKIADADAFVADVTPINTRPNGSTTQARVLRRLIRLRTPDRPCPNPNVSTELGYAMARVGNEGLILVVNSFYCSIENLPFDLRPLRTLAYHASPSDDVAPVRKQLSKDFENAIKSIADVVRGDPVDAVLYRKSVQIAGQAFSLYLELARAGGFLSENATEEVAQESFGSATSDECVKLCSAVNPNASAPCVVGWGAHTRDATWYEYMRYHRERSGILTKEMLVFSSFLKREHIAVLMRVEHSDLFTHLDQVPGVANTSFAWLAPWVWSYFQSALELRRFSEKYLARRVGSF